jgi:hypothetical protein
MCGHSGPRAEARRLDRFPARAPGARPRTRSWRIGDADALIPECRFRYRWRIEAMVYGTVEFDQKHLPCALLF